MARILLTSGPTRQYIDPVRYLTNASSGRMGCSLAEAAVAAGHDVVIVSGPVSVTYPAEATVHWVDTTDEMLEEARKQFDSCDGLIGVAAPCDYRPEFVQDQKIAKTGQPLVLQLIETPDIVATLGAEKKDRWVVGFALETEDRRFRALVKLEKKSCDLMVLNGPEAMNSEENQVEVLAKDGSVVATIQGNKSDVATQIMQIVTERLVQA
ncbi:phosphopantothenoylcysteine decarboxylase domain-containing protein [Bremerella sp. T1]|uniref:phosphopantothenoylcysteine decarboxylase domain-containing protein n=1 Tax=Bremerella sp. TYQ1 TaxID=3119568 RepID=UPI001CCBAAE1|nr:phosphopantothenoylcysteine decarboxylase [Bremerella volcania]UBM36089.1 phosphopantothenoylcysteine decarboxylase [Bremerella volcania]